MEKQKIIIFALLATYSVVQCDEKVRFDHCQVYRVIPNNQTAISHLRELEQHHEGFSFWTSPSRINRPVDIMVPPHLQAQFRNIVDHLGLETELYIANVQELIDNERPNVRDSKDFGWTDYHTLDEINAWLKQLADENPDKVTLLKGGMSYEGRDILGVHVTFGPGNENRSVFVEGNIHAREWISSAVATFVLNEILTSSDPVIRNIAESHDWYVFPVFNPDGFVYTHTVDRTWRKTRVPYGLCVGADPNRNWNYHYNEGGTSGFACSETYRGPNAFSEPSVKSMSQFIDTIGSSLRAYIGLHSYSQLLLIPYGFSDEHLDNYDNLFAIGKKTIQSLAKRYGTQYTTGNIVDIIYIASGGSMDWVKGIYKTPITYTYELRDLGRYGFLLPANEIIPSGEEILDSLVTMLTEFDKILPY